MADFVTFKTFHNFQTEEVTSFGLLIIPFYYLTTFINKLTLLPQLLYVKSNNNNFKKSVIYSKLIYP